MGILLNSGIRNELYYQTQVTLNQFISIGEKFRKGDIVNEIYNNKFFF
jgi:hypothetical protein